MTEEPEIIEEGKGEDKKEIRKPRVNIAMAAIMRKQEETNKQVCMMSKDIVVEKLFLFYIFFVFFVSSFLKVIIMV